MQSGPDVSVIISTYNAPRWLELVLEGYFCQAFAGSFELVIADDGSTEQTARLIERMSSRSAVPIRHIWQPDEGFQKCRILNKAIANASGELLLFTDGDCIPQPNMVQTHFSRARPGSFLTGGYLKLPMSVADAITVSDIKAAVIFQPGWLIQRGLRPSAKLLKLMLPHPWDRLANYLTPTKRTWNGHNSSCYRKDAVVVNGFNEVIQYGGQDVEFGCRLNHAGVQGRHLRFSTIPLHLHHGHAYVTPGMLEHSAAERLRTSKLRLIAAERGLDQWLSDDDSWSPRASDKV
jgi:glycosyltransferase involved in cell wall biosynthesis